MAERTVTLNEVPKEFGEFIAKVKGLDRGDLAILRRNAGNTIAESRSAMGLFYRIVPPVIAGTWNEELYFLVATLYGLNDHGHGGDFGSTMRTVRMRTDSESIDRRMAILLDSEFNLVNGRKPGGGEMAYRLRQAVKLAAGHEVGIDWPRLLEDLCWWTHREKRVRKQWARSYYGTASSETRETEHPEGGE